MTLSMSDLPFVVIGGGGHAKVVIGLLTARSLPIEGYVENIPPHNGEDIFGVPCLGTDEALEAFPPGRARLAIGIGDGEIRAGLFERFISAGYCMPHLIHPSATVDPTADIADGVQVMAGAVLQADAKLAENIVLNTGCRIDHDCLIGRHALIGPGAVLCGGVSIGEHVTIGANATVIQGVTIGDHAVVGAGAVVLQNVNARIRVAGVPAKEIENG